MDTLTVRYFAGAMAAAGVEEETVPMPPAASVGDLADELGRRHGPALAAVLDVASFLVDAVATPRHGTLTGARAVDVLPPFAGG